MDEVSNIVKDIKTLRTGEGSVRIRISMGYSREVPLTGIWVKPSIDLEVTQPLDVETDEYIRMIVNYLTPKLKELEKHLVKLAGFNPTKRG